MNATHVTLVFCLALLVQLGLRLWLTGRQARHVAAHADAVPAPFADRISLEAHQRAAAYTLARLRLGVVSAGLGAMVLIAWTLLGGLDLLQRSISASGLAERLGPLGAQLLLLGAFALIQGLIELPLSAWQTFRVEQAHGFNRMTWRLFALDTIKGALVGVLLGLPLAALILTLMAHTGRHWWLAAWGVWTGFNLLMMVVFPTVIAPWFNQFKPLDDPGIAQRVQALMARCGFRAKGLFVMDGSRRSAHANAYFTGFGAAKRVVFFDTLLQRLDPDEIDAVLAHELGHFKHRHVLQRMIGLSVASLLGFGLLGWLSGQAAFYEGLGVTPALNLPTDATALILFTQVAPIFAAFLGPLLAGWSRRQEFEADAYACAQAPARHLVSALVKLYEDNASTLTPDPVYVRFYYSHPPAVERIAAMPASGPGPATALRAAGA